MAEAHDKSINLTEEEKDVVRNTWSIMKNETQESGIDLFLRLFTAYPTYQQLFRSFKNVPLTELRTNKKYLAHVTNVIFSISMLVDNLDDPEVLSEMVAKLAENHNRRKLGVQHFENIREVLIGLITAKVGTQLMNQFGINAWHKTWNIIVELVKRGFDQIDQNSD